LIAILIYFEVEGAIRIVLGLPFILLIPGYVTVFALFPEKSHTHRGIETVERVALSMGISIAIVPLIGLALNYTPWGIRLEPILSSLLLFVFTTSILGVYRWGKIGINRRHQIELQIGRSSMGGSRLDQTLIIALVVSIVAAVGVLIWALTTPRIGKRFTEFYILGPEGIADGYPTNLGVNQSSTIILGIQNHEYENLTYHVEVWIINQTWDQEVNTTHYYWGILLDSFTLSLPHMEREIDQPWTPQWEQNYTLQIPVTGQNKATFLLFIDAPPTTLDFANWSREKQGSHIIQERVEAAYRATYLWINVD
jgi:uncharacterized membrane protein